MRHILRPYLITGIAILGAGVIAVPPALLSNVQAHAVRLANDENVAFIVGGSGDPIPDQDYVDTNNSLYVQPNFPGYDPQALYTPEGNYALYTGVKSLTLDKSEAQGVQILDNAVRAHLDGNPANHVAVLGDSQSSTISSMVMPLLHDQGVSPDQLGFVLLADPNQPNGGLFERLDGVTIPSLGITFNGATPDDLYPTTIYLQAYDGFADVPRYPINFLSDLNSILGIQFIHPTYQGLTANDWLPVDQGGKAVELPTVGDTMTTYWAIPTENLPLLDVVRVIPVIGNPLADFLQPILKPLVNLGYGDPDFGWSTAPANVPTEFGLFPSFGMTLKAFAESVEGIPKGIEAAIADLGSMSPAAFALPDLSGLMHALAADPISTLTNIVNTLSGAFATAYSELLPTADVLTALAFTVPNYDFQWFLEGLEHLDLFSAIMRPIANNTYLFSMAAGFEIFTLINTVETIGQQLSSLF
ncbi:MAG TPA: PE-PPE domain-containing protein [Mycobacterium sp.]|nr:PE-PPE domain-containing protein [Mycobacterium sp.]